MKNLFKIIPIFFVVVSCKAQIISIEDSDGIPVEGAYYKDVNNLLDPFEGTYVYTNGNTSLTIILKKRIMSSMNGYYSEDLLIGEYRYVKEGVEKSNTLNDIDVNFQNQASHSIDGNQILKGPGRGCYDCPGDEVRFSGGLVEKPTGNIALLLIRKITQNGQPAILLNVWWQMRTHPKDEPALLQPTFPGGDYILIKQP